MQQEVQSGEPIGNVEWEEEGQGQEEARLSQLGVSRFHLHRFWILVWLFFQVSASNCERLSCYDSAFCDCRFCFLLCGTIL